MGDSYFRLNEQSAIKILHNFLKDYEIRKIEYGLDAFLEPPRRTGEGFKILIDCWVLSRDLHDDVMKYFRKMDYRCEYVHREWGTYIMIA